MRKEEKLTREDGKERKEVNVGGGGGGERGRKEGWGTEMQREGEGGPGGVETWETKLGVNSVCRMREIYLRNGILYIRDIHMLYTVQYSIGVVDLHQIFTDLAYCGSCVGKF